MGFITVILAGAMLSGCAAPGPNAISNPTSATDGWIVEKVTEVSNLAVPECAAVCPDGGDVFISNIDAPKEGPDNRYNTEDNQGFITRLKPGGALIAGQWVKSEVNAPIHSIKGLCVLKGVIYACDVDHVRRMSIKTGQALEPIYIRDAQFLNDAATDGEYVYVSDSNTNKIHRLDGMKVTDIPAPNNPNGIAFENGKMIVVSWAEHEIYEVDMDCIVPPKPFGLADKFEGLDGVEVLSDGTFIVSDQKQNRLALIGADRKSIRTLVKVKGGPADFGIDAKRGFLYVPMIWNNSLTVFKLTNTRK
jgi:DNA-binding beta-propeller fold protein YncE